MARTLGRARRTVQRPGSTESGGRRVAVGRRGAVVVGASPGVAMAAACCCWSWSESEARAATVGGISELTAGFFELTTSSNIWVTTSRETPGRSLSRLSKASFSLRERLLHLLVALDVGVAEHPREHRRHHQRHARLRLARAVRRRVPGRSGWPLAAAPRRAGVPSVRRATGSPRLEPLAAGDPRSRWPVPWPSRCSRCSLCSRCSRWWRSERSVPPLSRWRRLDPRHGSRASGAARHRRRRRGRRRRRARRRPRPPRAPPPARRRRLPRARERVAVPSVVVVEDGGHRVRRLRARGRRRAGLRTRLRGALALHERDERIHALACEASERRVRARGARRAAAGARGGGGRAGERRRGGGGRGGRRAGGGGRRAGAPRGSTGA